ncbi:MAG: hypothetical protein ACOCZ6_01340 [Nanoarchaeota archaeon]
MEDDVLKKLYLFLKNKIHTEKREFKDDEVRFYDKSSEEVIIPVVKRKQAPGLEKKLRGILQKTYPHYCYLVKAFIQKMILMKVNTESPSGQKHVMTQAFTGCQDLFQRLK